MKMEYEGVKGEVEGGNKVYKKDKTLSRVLSFL